MAGGREGRRAPKSFAAVCFAFVSSGGGRLEEIRRHGAAEMHA